jgi:PAS domain S-box-containing protein
MYPDGHLADSWFERLVEAAPDAILVADRNRRITFVNRGTERLFGFNRAELLGQPLEMLIPERYRTQHPEHFSGFIADPKTRAMVQAESCSGCVRTV